ncbi:Oidioi.mRNA.OKI2018_I69.chr1.g154.t1.cds [Oikopleura dioica]|uniref:Oidioi.mRNA.OKI2018_I69.chr1.g154.t1.cds n=1 Tax=Oikopleura dioica TaxID=34765 RepID=A0ABN7SMP9_OIKDI|nr:Oidioi.mRNA.OKI2018_I69.chr1.g154.t1.cds [Oikopleura dioica]
MSIEGSRDSREEFLKTFDQESQLTDKSRRANSNRASRDTKTLLLKFLFGFLAIFALLLIGGAVTTETKPGKSSRPKIDESVLKVEVEEIIILEERNRKEETTEMPQEKTLLNNFLGRWQEESSTGVAEYIDAEGGSIFYKMFAKKMKCDIEYNKIEPNVYQSTFYLTIGPPMKFPLRFDQPYQHKSPTGDQVVSVAEFRPGFNDIIAKTKGGHEGTTQTNIQMIDSKLHLTTTMLDKNISCTRVYSRKPSDL